MNPSEPTSVIAPVSRYRSPADGKSHPGTSHKRLDTTQRITERTIRAVRSRKRTTENQPKTERALAHRRPDIPFGTDVRQYSCHIMTTPRRREVSGTIRNFLDTTQRKAIRTIRRIKEQIGRAGIQTVSTRTRRRQRPEITAGTDVRQRSRGVDAVPRRREVSETIRNFLDTTQRKAQRACVEIQEKTGAIDVHITGIVSGNARQPEIAAGTDGRQHSRRVVPVPRSREESHPETTPVNAWTQRKLKPNVR